MEEAIKRRGRPPSPGGPKSTTERSREHRKRLQRDGGRMLQVELTPEGARVLAALVEQHGSNAAAINAALLAYRPAVKLW